MSVSSIERRLEKKDRGLVWSFQSPKVSWNLRTTWEMQILYGNQFRATHSSYGIPKRWADCSQHRLRAKSSRNLTTCEGKDILYLLDEVTQPWTEGLWCNILWSCFHSFVFGVSLGVLASIFRAYHLMQVASDDSWHFKAPPTLINFKPSFMLEQEPCKGRVFKMLKSDKALSSLHLSPSVTCNSNLEWVSRKETKLPKLEKFWTLFKLKNG